MSLVSTSSEKRNEPLLPEQHSLFVLLFAKLSGRALFVLTLVEQATTNTGQTWSCLYSSEQMFGGRDKPSRADEGYWGSGKGLGGGW